MYKLKQITLRDALLQSSATYSERPALGDVEEKHILRYRDLAPLAAAFASRLRKAGLVPGDRVVLLSENRPEWGLAYLGITAAGFAVVPVLTDFHPDQIAAIAAHSEARAAVVSEKLAPKLGAFSGFVVPVESLATEEARAAAASEHPETAFPPLDPETLAAIIYTSGTTGSSKGVMLTHRNLVSNVLATRSVIHLHRTDLLLSILPLAHTYECTIGFLAPIIQGSSIRYMDKPPVASVLLPALKRLRPTIMLTVPLIMEKVYRSSVLPSLQKMSLYKHAALRPLFHWLAGIKLKKTFGGRMRFFGIGGAALSPDVEQFLLEAKFPYSIGYGLTETAPLIAGAGPFRTRLRSTGPALRGVDVRIADPHPDTGEGEIQARGPNVMKGYYKDPERTAEVFTPDGWFRTGDLGVFDRKGRLYIRGRLKTMILGASGENIYPEELEALINRSEYVAESLVYGDKGGLTALIHLKPEVIDNLRAAAQDRIEDAERGAEDLLERLRKEANARLAAFNRISKMVLHREPFEKTPTQKIKRFLYPKKQGT